MADKTSGKLKVRAEDNPWYLLATLYGQPTARDDELAKRNRVAWNRYMASAIRDETQIRLDQSWPTFDRRVDAVLRKGTAGGPNGLC